MQACAVQSQGSQPALFRLRLLTVTNTLIVFLITGFLSQQRCLAQNAVVNNLTAVPIPGVGHDYIHDLSEIVNPANGSVSIRIEAPRPKERGLNYPFYAFIYDSTQQFSLQYSESTGQAYSCGPDSAGDNPNSSEPPQPLRCISAVQFHYQSISAPSGLQQVLSGPNSLISNNAQYSRRTDEITYKTCNLTTGFSYEDPYGVIHELGAYSLQNSSNTDDCSYLGINPSPLGGDEQYKFAVQDTFTNLTIPQTHTLTYSSFGQLIDTHGDAVQVTSVGPVTALPMEDTNGNAVNGTSRSGTYQSFQPWGDALASPRTAARTFAGGATYNYTWGTATTHFSPASQDVSISQNNLCGAPGLGPSGVTTNPVVVELTEPDELSYTFNYDPTYGLLNKITYPTGAWVEYTWGVNSLADATGYLTPPDGTNSFNDPVHIPVGGSMNTSCIFRHDTPAIVKRVVSYDGVNAALEQDFSYSTVWNTGQFWSSKQTTVTTKDLLSPGTPSFTTIYSYIPWPVAEPLGSHLISSPLPLENTIVYKNTGGSVLRTTTKAWNSYLQLSGECTTLPNGKTSGKFYHYQPYTLSGYFQPVFATALTTNLVTDDAEYDYGQVSNPCQRPTSTPTRDTVTTYTTFSNTPLWPTLSAFINNQTVPISMQPMADRPSTVVTYQNGTKVSETDYSYDGTTIASVSPAPFGHDENNYQNGSTVARGNATTITIKCFVARGTCQDSASAVQYDTTGQPVSVTDANGNQTQLSYTDNYTTDDGSPSQNTNTYVKTITRPSTFGVAHTETFQWDFNKGEVRTVQDENGNVTSYQYNDPWNRLRLTQFPDSGQVNIDYQDAGPNPSVTTSTLLNINGQTLVSKKIMDAWGHVIQTQLLSDPVAVDNVDTTYDGLGRVSSVSNPYRSTTESSYGLTTFAYDSLNRKTLQVQPDHGVQQWCYDGVASSAQTNCTAITSSNTNVSWIDFSDENSNHWQRGSDAWNRLSFVVEPNGSSTAPSMETDYSYDGNDNLISAVQSGSGSGAVSRSFAYDSLSHLIAANNPENASAQNPASRTCLGTVSGSLWTTCYSYDKNGNLLTKTDNRNVTISYSYDALNRLNWKHYSDGFTIAAGFGYDGLDATGQPISGETNGVGRLSQTSELTAHAISNYSYDSMGRVIKKQSCIPGDCNYDVKVNATYDLNGNPLTLSNGSPSQPITFTYTYDAANRLASITSNWVSGLNHPPTIFQASSTSPAAYGPIGLQYALLGVNSSGTATVTLNRLYDSRMRLVYEGDTNNAGTSLYSFCVPSPSNSYCSSSSSGYTLNGNLQQVSDSVMGNWTFQSPGYDTLNRLVNGQATSGPYNGQYGCWQYDVFGNRTKEAISSTVCPQSPVPTTWASYNLRNQVTATGLMPAGYIYDAAGNVLNDGLNQYLYDGESRICAVKNSVTGIMTGYIYDAGGNRYAKGSISSWSCSLSSNGFTVINGYVIGLKGEQLTETDGGTGWVHTHVFAGGLLLATYSSSDTFFELNDWLGTKRADAGVSGCLTTWQSLPYGDSLTASGNCSQDSSELHFTGKERDAESGLDYFKYRMYASSMGRWMSPDPSGLTHADLGNPQSLNLYNYVGNSPLTRADLDGLCWKGFQWACDIGQRVDNLFHGEGFRTDQGVENYLHKANQFLNKHGISTEGMKGPAVMSLYGKTFQTYRRAHLRGGPDYVGRTSGTGTPEQNIAKRGNYQPKTGEYGPPELDKSSSNPNAIRGREQQLIEANGGAQSQGGTSGNAINGISETNPNKSAYMSAAEAEFGAEEGATTAEEVITTIEILNDIPD